MATQVMSARVDADKLKYANNLTQKKYGMSFAKYCGTVVLDNVYGERGLPLQQKDEDEERERRLAALRDIREFAESLRGNPAANLSDEDVKRIIRNREFE